MVSECKISTCMFYPAPSTLVIPNSFLKNYNWVKNNSTKKKCEYWQAQYNIVKSEIEKNKSKANYELLYQPFLYYLIGLNYYTSSNTTLSFFSAGFIPTIIHAGLISLNDAIKILPSFSSDYYNVASVIGERYSLVETIIKNIEIKTILDMIYHYNKVNMSLRERIYIKNYIDKNCITICFNVEISSKFLSKIRHYFPSMQNTKLRRVGAHHLEIEELYDIYLG